MGVASTKCSAVELPPISLQYRVIIKASGAADERQRLEALRAQKAMRNDLSIISLAPATSSQAGAPVDVKAKTAQST